MVALLFFRSSSIFKNIEVVFLLIFFRSSSIFINIEVVFHISSSWVRIRLHTKNQLPRLPGSGLKCNHICGVVLVWWCGGSGGGVILIFAVSVALNCNQSGGMASMLGMYGTNAAEVCYVFYR